MRTRFFFIPAVIAIIGCVSQPASETREIGVAEHTETRVGAPAGPLDTPSGFLTAQELLNKASEFLTLAEEASPAVRADYQLKAAEALVAAGRHRPALRLLESINLESLPQIFAARRELIRARIAIHDNRPETAFQLLSGLENRPGLSPQLQEQLWQQRARTNLLLDRPLDAIRALIAREQYLARPDELIRNQRQIWTLLNRIKMEQLSMMLQSVHEDVLIGWIELALAHMEYGHDGFRLRQEIQRWQNLYPRHSANRLLQYRATALSGPSIIRPRHIALLLPLASEYGRAAQAVHDGFMAAHSANGDPDKPTIKVYDIGAEAELAPVYYRLAVQEGADLLVGPLGKQAVAVLVGAESISVPTLLLGSADDVDTLPRNAFQFDLSPEQEAEQTALRAYLDGHRTTAVLYPETSWGERVNSAFARRWQELGGAVLESRPYIEDRTDYSLPIREVLNIDTSEARQRALSGLLRTKLQFQPRRRQDVDFLFLAAKTATARLLKPQINFYHAHDLPVYSTSHVFAGAPDPVNDADLNGIVFGDMPWMLVSDGFVGNLRERIQGAWPYAHTALDRLYALGMDTYAIIPSLIRLREDQQLLIEGVTARLSMDRRGRVIRQLSWAKFDDGRPVILDLEIGAHRNLYDLGSERFGDTLEAGALGRKRSP